MAEERVLDRQIHTRFHWANMGSKHVLAGTVAWVVVAAPKSPLAMKDSCSILQLSSFTSVYLPQ